MNKNAEPMAEIAPHLHNLPAGHPKTYALKCAWPETCLVQWGATGIVFAGKDSYETAFFEAFPKDNSAGFIRGEGKTIADAELHAYGQWRKSFGCDHRWGRQSYRNGGALCYKCGAFQTVFREIVEIGAWKKPLTIEELYEISHGDFRKSTDPYLSTSPTYLRFQKRLATRARMFEIELPPDDDPSFEIHCMAEVIFYAGEEYKRLSADSANPEKAAKFLKHACLFDFGKRARLLGVLPGTDQEVLAEKPSTQP